jgi:hypothetical protein
MVKKPNTASIAKILVCNLLNGRLQAPSLASSSPLQSLFLAFLPIRICFHFSQLV